MKQLVKLVVLLVLLTSIVTGFSQTNSVEIRKFQWRDQKRNRNIPVKIYFAGQITNRMPVILFSHPLGGSRDGAEYLGRHWASNGFFCVHLQHPGSDVEYWSHVTNQTTQALLDSVNPGTITNRILDVKFAIDKLTEISVLAEFKDRLNLQKIGVAGDSFGAMTALAIGGEIFDRNDGYTSSRRDGRVKALLTFNAPLERGMLIGDGTYSTIRLPCLHLIGSRDVTARHRRLPYDEMPGPDDYLIIFKNADTSLFSGNQRSVGNTVKYFEIQKITTAFWNVVLKNDSVAKKWLEDDDVIKFLNGDAVLERK